MCGISGWIDWEVDITQQRAIIEQMNEKLSYRGPDASGIWLAPQAGIAHRRLIVIDPEGGAQPMVRQRGDNIYVITYNGELYNTFEIRRELEARGYFFRGYSDTEALLLSYIEWGAECVDRLNGIFAFAIWNNGNRSLFCARDRLGVKPFFYAIRGSAFLFASEIKALLAHPLIQPEIDTEGLAEIFITGPARTPGIGVFRGICELKQGHSLFYDQNGLRVNQYWHLKSRPHEDDLGATTIKIHELVQDTVVRQLVSDVPVCLLLSGGLDSSAITAFASRHYYKKNTALKLHTYSVDFVDNERYFTPNSYEPDPDTPWINRVADFFNTCHHHIEVEIPALVDALKQATLARDLPGMADVDASLFLFCREIKKQATVALSGESADEIFGGYPWFHRVEDVRAGTFPWIRMVKDRARLLSPEIRAFVKPEEYVNRRYQEALDEVPRLPGEERSEELMRIMTYLNITRFMQILLDRKDRMSMAVGLEVRVPYCDHRLVEYVWNIPWAMKNYKGMNKGIFRRALESVLPEEVLLRRKKPYPKTHHPEYHKAVRDWLINILHDSTSPLVPLLDKNFVDEIVRTDGVSFGPAWFSQLMGPAQLFAYLVQVDVWLREYGVRVIL